MVIRFLHVGRKLSAIEASSPFDKVFYDFQRSNFSTSGYNLFVKEHGPAKKNLPMADRLKEVGQMWKTTPQITKDKFNERAKIERGKTMNGFLDKYVSDQQFNAVYKGDFGNVKSEMSKLYNNCLDIKVKENREFLFSVKKMYDLKRDSVTNIKTKWLRVNRVKAAQFEKLSAAEKAKIKAQYISEYRMFLDQMKAAFPEHEIPSFLMVEANENSEKYKHDIRIYRKIAREIKNVKSEEKLNKKIRTSVNEEMAKHQIALRSKMGFTAGSEKKSKSAYVLFTMDAREQAKKTTSAKISMAELGKKWRSLSQKEKDVWVKKQASEINKTKIMNKGAVQRTIQAPIENCIALTMDEAKANLNNEQLHFYKKILAEKRKEITEKIAKEMAESN